MTREYVLLMLAGVLIAIGLFVIVAALRRAKRRDEARERVDALLTLLSEPAPIRDPEVETEESWDGHFREAPTPEPRSIAPAPVSRPRPIRVASAPQFVFTRSDSSGSFGIRPGSSRGQTAVGPGFDQGQTSV